MKSKNNNQCGSADKNDIEEKTIDNESETVESEIGLKEEELEDRLAEAEAKAQENWNMYLRALADLENYRRRTARDLAFHIRSGKKDVFLKILGVIDDMERALVAKADYKALHDGVKIILRKLLDILDAEGVKPIKAIGAPFDPKFHEAVTVSEDSEIDTDIVVEEFRRGYTYDDEIIRATMARVARPANN